MAKKKIKKALKMAVPLIGAALAGKALMGRRNRNRQMKNTKQIYKNIEKANWFHLNKCSFYEEYDKSILTCT